MKRDAQAPALSAIFVDYDNIYLSLRRRNEDAAKRFAKESGTWLRAIEQGRLISSAGGIAPDTVRRVVLTRCYGNPVPRRNPNDNSTDMNSFPFVRHHFLRSGFEIIDCPPLTAQQKNAADIRMVMDLRDCLTHATYFDEFIIMSGDADFTPVLHRLRQHARRTVIYSNDHTAAAYSAICDGEIREADLIAVLTDMGVAPETVVGLAPPQSAAPASAPPTQARLEDLRQAIMAEVAAGVRAASGPVPLEALADRALRQIGHDRTIGTAWAGAGSFRELVRGGLPADLKLTEQPPFYVYDPRRHGANAQPTAAVETAPVRATATAEPVALEPQAAAPIEQRMAPPPRTTRPLTPLQPSAAVPPPSSPSASAPAAIVQRAPSAEPVMHRAPAQRVAPSPAYTPAPKPDQATLVQDIIARIHEACQAPPLAPAEYRGLFEAAAQEITENGLAGALTLAGIGERCQARGINARREDVRFVLDVVSEADPWFEQGASANLFAGRFRNYVVARCREAGLALSADELDVIDAWFTGAPMPDLTAPRHAGVQPAGSRAPLAAPAAKAIAAPAPAPEPAVVEPVAPAPQAAPAAAAAPSRGVVSRWWSLDEGRQQAAEARAPAGDAPETDEDFPRIVRTRQRG